MKKLHILFTTVLTILLSTGSSRAASILDTNLLDVNQAALESGYDAFVKDAGLGLHFNPGNSGGSLSGAILPFGIKISGEMGLVGLSSGAKDLVGAAGGGDLSMLPVPKMKIQAGIPFGIDFGYHRVVLNDQITSSGFEVRYDVSSFIPIPLLDLAARYHTESGKLTDDLDISSMGVDVTVGVAIPIIKPYLNVGTLSVKGTPSDALANSAVGIAAGISTKTHNMTVTTIGAKLKPFPLFSLYGEYTKSGDTSLTSIGAGIDF